MLNDPMPFLIFMVEIYKLLPNDKRIYFSSTICKEITKLIQRQKRFKQDNRYQLKYINLNADNTISKFWHTLFEGYPMHLFDVISYLYQLKLILPEKSSTYFTVVPKTKDELLLICAEDIF